MQFDEPYLQARPDPAKDFGVAALNRALEGLVGTTAVHLCFGYAAIIHERPSGYSFLAELADCTCDQVSIETAQSGLDPEVLSDPRGQAHHPRRPGPVRPRRRAARGRGRPGPAGLRLRRPPEDLVLAPDCGMKYLPRASAEGKLRSLTAAAATLRAELGG